QSQITASGGSFTWSRGGSGFAELFISEYVEGSSNNKYIEIYNGTGADVDLSNYQLLLFTNGNTNPGNTNTLSGILADGDVVVYSNSSASIYQGTTINASAVGFNGDDAIGLFNTATNSYADIFGHIGEDPGSQ
ncbi:MAG: lamin tail domain-containing protein, partial [Bacteroidota bacterium]